MYQAWKEKIIEGIPQLNHDVLAQVALQLAFESKVNDKQIWRAIEDASVAVLHHMTLQQVCQLEWASME